MAEFEGQNYGNWVKSYVSTSDWVPRLPSTIKYLKNELDTYNRVNKTNLQMKDISETIQRVDNNKR
jgi:hypothetical protein